VNENNNNTWKTKHGVRRVRQEKPTLSEAIAAARDLSDEIDAQVEIAASLMGLPQEEVRAALLKQAPEPKEPARPVVFSRTAATQRTVVVEYKRASRR
jgi:hypothetical protein